MTIPYDDTANLAYTSEPNSADSIGGDTTCEEAKQAALDALTASQGYVDDGGASAWIVVLGGVAVANQVSPNGFNVTKDGLNLIVTTPAGWPDPEDNTAASGPFRAFYFDNLDEVCNEDAPDSWSATASTPSTRTRAATSSPPPAPSATPPAPPAPPCSSR